MRTHKLINDFTDIDEKFLLDALGKGDEEKQGIFIAQNSEPIEVRAGRTSPLRIIVPIAAAAAAIALMVPVGVNIMRNRNDGKAVYAAASEANDATLGFTVSAGGAGMTDSTEKAEIADPAQGITASKDNTSEPEPNYAATDNLPNGEVGATPAPSDPPNAAAPVPDVTGSAVAPLIIRSYSGGSFPHGFRFAASAEELKALIGGERPELDVYDDKFFEAHNVVVVKHDEGSGSIKLSVRDVKITKSDPATIVVNLDRVVPEVGTADMAYWHILIAVDKNLSEANAEVDVHISDIDRNKDRNSIPPLEMIAEMSEEEAGSALAGRTAGELAAAWGAPPAELSGMNADIWHYNGGEITAYYDESGKVIDVTIGERGIEGVQTNPNEPAAFPPVIVSKGSFTMEEFPECGFEYSDTMVKCGGEVIFSAPGIKRLVLADINGDGTRELVAVTTKSSSYNGLVAYDFAKKKGYVYYSEYDEIPLYDLETDGWGVNLLVMYEDGAAVGLTRREKLELSMMTEMMLSYTEAL